MRFARPTVGQRFNPLPLPKQGETFLCGLCEAEIEVSIRSPYRSKGRLHRVRLAIVGIRVSIRSPYRSKGRRIRVVGHDLLLAGFNPLPLPKQGETTRPTNGCLVAFVSIRSPYRSKGRPTPKTNASLERLVSIRSPYRSKGRRWSL